MKKLLTFLKWFAIAIVAIFLLVIGDWGAFKGYVTDYAMQCETELVNGQCESSYFGLNTTTYKPDVKRQDVVYWTNGIQGIERITNCAVVNRKNWSCKYDDGSAEFGFNGGQYFETTYKASSPATEEIFSKIFHVSRWEWLKYNLSSNR